MPWGPNTPGLFRIWLAECANWEPTDWQDLPPQAKVIEPAITDCLSERDAALFVEGFNATILARESNPALSRPRRLWAIAVPVEIQYRGDFASGSYVQPATAPFERQAQ